MTRYAWMFSVLLCGGSARGQAVLVGVKGAVPLLEPTLYNTDESRPYNVGPSVEVRLPKGFAIEADALYQRVGQSGNYSFAGQFAIQAGVSGPFVTGVVFNRTRGNSWEFPMLGKRYFRRSASGWQPFVSLGPSLRTTGFQTDSNGVTIESGQSLTSTDHFKYRSNLGIGAAAAVGVRLRKGRIAFLPEFRYTRWNNNGSVLSRNAAGAFLGVSF